MEDAPRAFGGLSERRKIMNVGRYVKMLVLACAVLVFGCGKEESGGGASASSGAQALSQPVAIASPNAPETRGLKVEFRPAIVWEVPVDRLERDQVIVADGQNGFWAFVTGRGVCRAIILIIFFD